MSTATPAISGSFSGANQLPAPLAGTVGTTLSLLTPQIPDIIGALGMAVAGGTEVADPTECSAPTLVE